MGRPASPDQLQVKAFSPFHIYFEGKAQSLSAANKVGPFDVLPGHSDFFSLLRPGDVIIDTGTEEISFPISNGILSVRNGEVMLFADI